MSTSRPFARNLNITAPAGTEKLGNLAIGIPTAGFIATGLNWYQGPDEDLGYVIAKDNPDGQSAADESTAFLGFWRTETFSDASFLVLGNAVLSTAYTSVAELLTALSNAGYWTSYVSGEELPSAIITSNNEYISLDEGVYLTYSI